MAQKIATIPRYHQDHTIPNGDWIWVFGSNLAGRHGAGAAKVARVNFRAKYGCGVGPTGKSYAIPTKDRHLNVIGLFDIEKSVQDFLRYVSIFPEKQFFVTRIGCDLSEYTNDQIGPMFKNAPANCSLPEEWRIYEAQNNVKVQLEE